MSTNSALSILSHLCLRGCLWNLYFCVACLHLSSVKFRTLSKTSLLLSHGYLPTTAYILSSILKAFNRAKTSSSINLKNSILFAVDAKRDYIKALHLLYCFFCSLRASRAFRVKVKEGKIQHVIGCTCRNFMLFSQDGGRKQDRFIQLQYVLRQCDQFSCSETN